MTNMTFTATTIHRAWLNYVADTSNQEHLTYLNGDAGVFYYHGDAMHFLVWVFEQLKDSIIRQDPMRLLGLNHINVSNIDWLLDEERETNNKFVDHELFDILTGWANKLVPFANKINRGAVYAANHDDGEIPF